MNSIMCFEQLDHFLRHVRMHVEEFKAGTFCKEREYLEKLKEARELAIDFAKEISHILVNRGIEEGKINVRFDISTSEDFEHHEFRFFDYDSFAIAAKVEFYFTNGGCFNMNQIQTAKLKEQLEILRDAIQDTDIFIQELDKYFNQ